MNLFLVGVELSPIAARSSAAEALLALSKTLRLLDQDVTIVMPYFENFASSGLMAARRITPLICRAGSARVYETALPSGARLVLLEVGGQPYPADAFSEGANVDLALGFADAVVRFVLERIQHGQGPDLVHALGARAGLALPLLRFEDAAIGRALSLFLPTETAELSSELLSEWKLEAAPVKAPRSLIETVLDAAEIVLFPSKYIRDSFVVPLGPRFSALRLEERGLAHVVAEGIDLGQYNPSSDPALPYRFTPHDRTGKGRSRARFLDEAKLQQGEQRPLVVLDLTRASGDASDRALAQTAGFVRQGLLTVLCVSKQKELNAAELAKEFPDSVTTVVEPGPARRRFLLGAADFWLLVGDEDGTGRAALEAQRYGAIPVVESSSAFAERVVHVDAELYSGTGLVQSAEESLFELVGRVIAAYRHANFSHWVGRVMAQDLAWDRAARRHLQLYRQLLRGSLASGRSRSEPTENRSAL